MPASASVSETFFLQLIWRGSLLLSLISIIVMIVLILRRMSLERKQATLIKRRQEITRCFYAALRSTVPLTPEDLPRVYSEDAPIIMRAALDTLRALRGDDTKRLMEVLLAWGMHPYLGRTAEKSSKGKRIQAVTLLGYFSDTQSLEWLLQHITDTDMYVQMAALRGLALRGAIEHIDRITQSLSRFGQTNTPMLSDILRRFGEPAVPSLLALSVSETAHEEVRIAAIMALGTIGSLAAVESLIDLADDPHINIRAQAVAALGKIGDNRAADSVAAHLTDQEPAVRAQAAQALGRLQVLSSLPKLAARVADDDWWVRFRAAESLYRFGDKGIAALRAISGQSTDAGEIAKQVLAEYQGIA